MVSPFLIDGEAVCGVIVHETVEELRTLLGPQGRAIALQDPFTVLHADLQAPGALG
jgi:hypothetical protein